MLKRAYLSKADTNIKMNKETPMFYADRMQFIVATMTKDYDKAKCIANTILQAEPEDTILPKFLSLLEKKTNKKKRVRDDEDVGESDGEPSVDSSSDNTDTNSDNDSDSETSSQNIANNKKLERRNFIETKKFCQRFNGKDLVFDIGEDKAARYANNRCNLLINEDKSTTNEFHGKIIRVLPIRLKKRTGGIKC